MVIFGKIFKKIVNLQQNVLFKKYIYFKKWPKFITKKITTLGIYPTIYKQLWLSMKTTSISMVLVVM
jgi:hypothetical protein